MDDAVELLSGYVPGEVDHHEQWGWPRPYRTYAELLGAAAASLRSPRRIGGSGEALWRRCPTGPPPWSSLTAVGSSRAGRLPAGCRPRVVGCTVRTL